MSVTASRASFMKCKQSSINIMYFSALPAYIFFSDCSPPRPHDFLLCFQVACSTRAFPRPIEQLWFTHKGGALAGPAIHGLGLASSSFAHIKNALVSMHATLKKNPHQSRAQGEHTLLA